MEQKNYINVRVRKETQYTLKIVVALCQESVLETFAQLVQQEYERLQQEGGKHNVALQKDQACCGKRQDMPLWKRVYRCTCGLVMDRDENSAHNILQRYFARLGPHTGDPVRCADVFTAITRSNAF